MCYSAFLYVKSQNTVAVRNHNLLSVDFNAMAYRIANASHTVNEFVFINCSISLGGVKHFLEVIGRDKLTIIKSFTFPTTVERGQFEALKYLLKNLVSLKTLNLDRMNLEERSTQILTDGLEAAQLETIKLRIPLISSNNNGWNNSFKNLKKFTIDSFLNYYKV